jgi:hypothetical protein
MRKQLTLSAVALLAAATLLNGGARAEEKAKAAETPEKRPSFYKVDYAIHEFDQGKRTNTRSYTLKVEARPDRMWNFRVGNRVPIATEKDKFNYYDVGVNLDCGLTEVDGSVRIETRLEINSVAGSEMASAPSTPVIRSLRLTDIAIAEPAKPTLVGAVDDVTSNRRYEIEVTAVKIK